MNIYEESGRMKKKKKLREKQLKEAINLLNEWRSLAILVGWNTPDNIRKRTLEFINTIEGLEEE